MPKGVYNRTTQSIEIGEPIAVGGGAGPGLSAEVVDLDAIRAELAAELAKAKELNAKLALKAEIRAEVSDAVMQQRRQDFGKRAEPVPYQMPPKPEGVEMFKVKLERNYAPEGYFEVVGWDKPAVYRKKFGHEKPVMVEPAEFVENEKAPPTVAGTGFAEKVWANTTVRLPKPEAVRVVAEKIASRGFD